MESELLEQLYRRYHRELYLYLFSLCRSAALAEDLVQETFLKALLALPDGHPNLRAWLYLVARNLYFSHCRREKHRAAEELPDSIPSQEEGPPEQLLAGEQARVLYRALSGLEVRRREVLLLQYFAGLSQREIAGILHLTPEHVRVLAHRARRELKQQLEANGYDIP